MKPILWKRSHPSYFDVTRYRAKGNGVDDDYSAIMRAVDAAAEYVIQSNLEVEPGYGATVVMPPGIYMTSDEIVIPYHNVNVIGEGCGGDKWTPHGTAICPFESFPDDSYVVKFDWTGLDDCLRNNILQGVRIAPRGTDEMTNDVHGLYWGVAKGRCEATYIDALTGVGIRLEGHSTEFKLIESDFVRLRVRRCLHGMEFIASCSDNWFDQCQFQGCVTGAGINGLSSNDYFQACHFTGNLNNIRSAGGGTEVLFQGCNFETPREHNILLDSAITGASRMRFIGCQINSNSLTAANTYDSVFITGSNGTFSGVLDSCTFAATGANAPRYHINFSNASASGFHADNCTGSGAATAFSNVGANSVRCTVNNLGRNVGDPNSTGAWLNQGHRGRQVLDTSNTKIYICSAEPSTWLVLN
jgi:hypothetical protein